MRAAPTSSITWAVSYRTDGEVLAVEARTPGVALWLLGQPEGSTRDELQGWLRDVAGVASESAAQDAAPQPIPALLRHALSGLLFSHSEMWGRNGSSVPLCSIAFTSGGDELGFGWVGEAVVTVLIDGRPADVRWVLVRDDRGRQARAWSIAPGHDVRVRITWSPDPTNPSGPVVVMEAHTSEGPLDAADPKSVVPIPEAGASAPIETVELPSEAPRDLTAAGPAAGSVDRDAVDAELESKLAAVERGALEPLHETESLPATEPHAPTRGMSAAAESAPASDIVARAGAAAQATPMIHAAPEPERPSSGIARWLSRNFAWLGGGRARHAAPEPPVARARAATAAAAAEPAEQQQLPGIASAHSSGPVAGEIAAPGIPPPASREVAGRASSPSEEGAATAAREDDAPDSVAASADVSPAAPDAPAEMAAAPARSHEDELAATAAALAAMLSGVEPEPAPPDAPRPPVLDIATPAAPERVFEVLPARIPPTPEPPAVTARTVAPFRTAAPRDPREIALPGDPAVESAPPGPATPRLVPAEAWRQRRGDPTPEGELDPRTLRTLGAPDEPEVAEPAPVPDDESVPVSASFAEAPLHVPDVGVADVAPASVDAPAVDAFIDDGSAVPVVAATTDAESDSEPATAAPPAESASAPAADSASAPAAPAQAGRRARPKHPEWPSEAEVRADVPRRSRSTWIALGGVIVVLFGIGWVVGTLQWNRTNAKEQRGPLGAVMALFGVRPPVFSVDVRSQPDGAWIVVDGKPTQQRTPATLQLAPGRHDVTLSFGEWGQAVYPVEGVRGASRHVDGTLWGSLEVGEPEPGVVVAVAVDGRPRGFAPLVVDSLAPGPHQVRFSGPGLPSWGETVEIRVATQQRLAARTVTSPATGIIEVRATLGGAPGSGALSGARVWIDGQPRGGTPLTLELPRGPHSVRVEYQGERAPVQVIDLPGGNQRFATFVFGAGGDAPEITVDAPARLAPSQTSVISATLADMPASDVREMWLHVCGPDDTWNRYPMTRLENQLHAVGAVAFPVSQLDPAGRARWYVSAVTAQGDEYFTEILTMQEDRPKR